MDTRITRRQIRLNKISTWFQIIQDIFDEDRQEYQENFLLKMKRVLHRCGEYPIRRAMEKAINIAQFISYSNGHNKEEYFKIYKHLLNEWSRILTSTSRDKKSMMNSKIENLKTDYPTHKFMISSAKRIYKELTRLVGEEKEEKEENI